MRTGSGYHRAIVPDHGAAARRLIAAGGSGELDGLCDEFGVRLLAVLGSALRNDPSARPRDLDVAVAFRPGVAGDLFGFVARLGGLAGPAELDPLDLDAAEPVVRAEALSGVPLYEDVAGAFAEARIAALLARWDTAWLRRLELELLGS
jgi:predicted nucleotidyltransferase